MMCVLSRCMYQLRAEARQSAPFVHTLHTCVLVVLIDTMMTCYGLCLWRGLHIMHLVVLFVSVICGDMCSCFVGHW